MMLINIFLRHEYIWKLQEENLRKLSLTIIAIRILDKKKTSMRLSLQAKITTKVVATEAAGVSTFIVSYHLFGPVATFSLKRSS